MSQKEIYYQAMLARDYRFDGKCFIGVKTTGIYCRPICPAKPHRKNVEFFANAQLAEKLGYRPCLRCRPECAPLSPAWYGKSAVVQRALKMIGANDLMARGEDQFAEQFGMTARHLRRLFEEEIGQTPKQISDNSRLNFARKLVTETRMPMATVADTAGFSSLRRFNDAFKKRFHRAPLQLRKGRESVKDSHGIELTLAFRPPYDWSTILEFFESHRIPGIEDVKDDFYERIFRIENEVGWLKVSPIMSDALLKLQIVVENPKTLFAIVTRVRRMFDLDSDPLLIANSFSQSKTLTQLYERFPGLRLPRGWDPFETAICTILGQLVSVEQAGRLVGQLVENYGDKAAHPITKEQVRIFPRPEVLAQSDLSEVKTTEARKSSIRELSRKMLAQELDFFDAQDPIEFRESLLSIRGIGQWSAEYICLRAIGDTDAFPATDLILRRAMELHRDLDLEIIKPWRSYAAIYLWKGYAKSLSKRKERKT